MTNSNAPLIRRMTTHHGGNMTRLDTNMSALDTVAKICSYIERHEELLGFRPLAVGLTYYDRIKVLKEMGASDFAARCTNVTANLHGVLLVEAVR